jgi:hypothetical protein
MLCCLEPAGRPSNNLSADVPSVTASMDVPERILPPGPSGTHVLGQAGHGDDELDADRPAQNSRGVPQGGRPAFPGHGSLRGYRPDDRRVRPQGAPHRWAVLLLRGRQARRAVGGPARHLPLRQVGYLVRRHQGADSVRRGAETQRCIAEGVIERTADAKIGSIFGIGFPAWTRAVVRYVE